MIILKSSPKLHISNKETKTPRVATVGKPLAKTERFSQLSEVDASKLLPADPNKRWAGLTTATRMAAMPEWMGGGQYMQDKNAPGQMLKSNRGTLNAIKSYNRIAKKGLPASQYEVDHILPLALGGSDTGANKQVYSKIDHAKKTAVGAVAQNLYFDGKITLGEARVLAYNWKDKDINGLEIQNGILSNKDADKVATKKYQEWQEVKPVTLKDVWQSGKEVVSKGLEKISKKVAEVAPNNPLGEFAKGFVSEAALGYVPIEQEKYGTETDQIISNISQMAGRVAGFLVPATLVGKAIKYGSKALMAASKLPKASKATKIAAAVPSWVESLKKTTPAIKDGKMIFSKNVAYKIFNNVATLGTVGQLSKQEEAGVEARAKRFLNDAAFGTIGGTFGGGMKGYGGVALSTYLTSAILDKEFTPASGMMNAAMMVGFHGVGRYKITEKMGDQYAHTYLQENGANIKPIGSKYTTQEAYDIMETTNRNVYAKLKEDGASYEVIQDAMKRNILSVKQLWKGGFSEEQRSKINLSDLKSLTKHVNKLTKDDINHVPAGVTGTLDKVPSLLENENFIPKEESWIVPENQYNAMKLQPTLPEPTEGQVVGKVTGKVKNYVSATGTSDKVNNFSANNIRDAVRNGTKAGDKVLIVWDDRPEYVKFKTKEGVENADKIIRFFKRTETPEGEKYYDFGFWPTIKNILEKINPRMSSYKLPEMYPEFDNLGIIDYMTKNNTKVMTGTIDYITAEAKNSGEPYVGLIITDKDYASVAETSKLFNKARISSMLAKNDDLIKQMVSGNVKKSTIKMVSENPALKHAFDTSSVAVKQAKKHPESLDGMFDENISEANKKELITKLGEAETVGDYYDFFGKLIVNNYIGKGGPKSFDYSFGNLSSNEIASIRSLKLSDTELLNLGELKPEPLKPVKRPELIVPKPVAKASVPVSEGQTTIHEAIDAAKKIHKSENKKIILTDINGKLLDKLPPRQDKFVSKENGPDIIIDGKRWNKEEVKHAIVYEANRDYPATMDSTDKMVIEIKDKMKKENLSIDELFKKYGKTYQEQEVKKQAVDAESGNFLKQVENRVEGGKMTEKERKELRSGLIAALKRVKDDKPLYDRVNNAINKLSEMTVGDMSKEKIPMKEAKLDWDVYKKIKEGRDIANKKVEELKGSNTAREDKLMEEMTGGREEMDIGSLSELEGELTPKSVIGTAIRKGIIDHPEEGGYFYKRKTKEGTKKIFLGENREEVYDYLTNADKRVFYDIMGDVNKLSAGFKYPTSDAQYIQVGESLDQSLKTAKSEPVKKYWEEIIKVIETKDKNFRKKYWPMKALENYWQSETVKKRSTGERYKLNTDAITEDIEIKVKSGQYDKLPEPIRGIVKKKLAENKDAFFLVGTKKKTYGKAYNLTEDVRKFVNELRGEIQFGRESLTSEQIGKIKSKYGMSDETVKEYIGNIGSADAALPIQHNTLYKALIVGRDIKDIKDVNDPENAKIIKRAAANAANMLAKIIKNRPQPKVNTQ